MPNTKQRTRVPKPDVCQPTGTAELPMLDVYNKCDRLEASRLPRQVVDWIERPNGQRVQRVFVSALDGSGIDRLRDVLAEGVRERLNAKPAPLSSLDDPRSISLATDPSHSSLPHHHA